MSASTLTVLSQVKSLVYEPGLLSVLLENMDSDALAKLQRQIFIDAKSVLKQKKSVTTVPFEIQEKVSKFSRKSHYEPEKPEAMRKEILELIPIFEKRKFRSIDKSESILLLFSTRKLKRNVFSIAHFNNDGELLDHVQLNVNTKSKKSQVNSNWTAASFQDTFYKMIKLENEKSGNHLLLLADINGSDTRLEKVKKDLFRILE